MANPRNHKPPSAEGRKSTLEGGGFCDNPAGWFGSSGAFPPGVSAVVRKAGPPSDSVVGRQTSALGCQLITRPKSRFLAARDASFQVGGAGSAVMVRLGSRAWSWSTLRDEVAVEERVS